MNQRNYLERLRRERNARAGGGAGPVSNLSELTNAQLLQAIANLEEALGEIGRRRNRKRPYKTPRTHRSRIEKRLEKQRKIIKNMEENKRWGSKVGLSVKRIYARKLKKMAPKKWPVRKSRTFSYSLNSSNANNLRVTGREGASFRRILEAVQRHNEPAIALLRERMLAKPKSPRTAASTLREDQRFQNAAGFGQESGTEAASPRQKRAYSSGSSSRNSKTPSPAASQSNKSASAGSAASTGRKNNINNK